MGYQKECGKRSTVLADGLAGAIRMQRDRVASPDRGFGSESVPKDCAGMLFYLSGFMSKQDPEASELLQEMGNMIREEIDAARGVAA
jgi:hypothetical protein